MNISKRFPTILRPTVVRTQVAVLIAAVLILSGHIFSFNHPASGQKSSEQSFIYPGQTWQRIEDISAAGYSSEGLNRVREYLKTVATTGLLVVVGGRVLFEYGNLEELSYLASVRKSILAILYGKYVNDGTIRLGTTLEELGINDHGGLLPIEKKATIGHLITARSGIYHPASNSGDNTADAPERGSQEPGRYFLYNNWDFNCAGYIFEQLTHQVVYDALELDLAIPLGMRDFNRLAQQKSGNMKRSRYPAYHIWLSTRDMARIGYLMLRNGRWQDQQVVPEHWVKRISRIKTPLKQMNPGFYRNGMFGYGYMWWVCDGPGAVGAFKGAYTASGAYGQYIGVLPAIDMVIAHKTAVPPRDRRVNQAEYKEILDRLIAARTK